MKRSKTDENAVDTAWQFEAVTADTTLRVRRSMHGLGMVDGTGAERGYGELLGPRENLAAGLRRVGETLGVAPDVIAQCSAPWTTES